MSCGWWAVPPRVERRPKPLAGPVVRGETTGDEHFALRGTCFSCGVAIVWPVLECPIPPSKRPLASFECFAPPRPCRAAASQSSARSSRPNCRWAVWSRRTRPPPSGGLQHGPAGCAVLLKARFDSRLDCCPSGDLGGEEGCAADRAPAMLELPLGARGIGTFRECQCLDEGIFGVQGFRALPTPVVRGRRPHCWMNFTMQNDLFLTSPSRPLTKRPA